MKMLYMAVAAASGIAAVAPAQAQGYGGYGYGYPPAPRYHQASPQTAVDACASQASRYGSARVRGAHPAGRSTIVVYGTVYNRAYQRSFTCSFHVGGWIADFDLGRRGR